ncbi:MAG: hypothetical protein J6Y19_05750, partial [Kiritimatiellae bacterium]|nr:hypothetical protein [Kiritimatiellia bacterium]
FVEGDDDGCPGKARGGEGVGEVFCEGMEMEDGGTFAEKGGEGADEAEAGASDGEEGRKTGRAAAGEEGKDPRRNPT